MAEKKCSIGGCDRESTARQLCMMHYQRERHGRVLDLPELKCPVCSSEFKPKTAQQRYCSRYCTNRRHTSVPLIMPCGYCGELFTRAAGRGRKLYCSLACRKIVTSIRSHERDYGISKTRYREILEAQNGLCAICQRPQTGRRKTVLCVDHDHACCPGAKSCGRCVRGLLCGLCNTGIGHLRDSLTLLRAAVNYLECYESREDAA